MKCQYYLIYSLVLIKYWACGNKSLQSHLNVFFSDSTPPKWSLALDKTAPWSLTSDTEEDEGGGSGEDEGHLVQLEIVHPSTEEGQTNMPVRTKVEFLISRAGVLRLPEAAQRSPAQELHWQMLPHTTIPVSKRNIHKCYSPML